MDIFTIDKLYYSVGERVRDIESVMWVERYRDAGEFTIIGEPTIDFMRDLALGTLISHINTFEVMIVENHEIDETQDGEIKVKITGRSVDAWVLENRSIQIYDYLGYQDPDTNDSFNYTMLTNDAWAQVVDLIANYVKTSILNPDESIPNFNVYHAVVGSDPNAINRSIPPGILYPKVLELLETFDGGIKTERPINVHSTLDFIVHNGVDRTADVQFNWLKDDIIKARYLWSSKTEINKTYVQSQYYGIPVQVISNTGWDLKVGHTDMNDYSDYYTGGDPDVEAAIGNLLISRGLKDLIASRPTSIMDAKISSVTQLIYGQHYYMGDIVFVRGNYGMEAAMRVTEYAISEDETGINAFPTLSAL